MPVPSSISDLSTTPALNSPPGSESPSSIDDYLRTHAAFIKQISDASVQTSGNQTVAGTKTFSASPVVPDATAAKHPVTKDQLDAKATIASPAFTGVPTAPNPTAGTRSQALATMQMFADEFVASLVANGYQKLPSGLIIQWGSVASSNAGAVVVTLPVAFPNAGFQAFSTPKDTFNGNASAADIISISQLKVSTWVVSSGGWVRTTTQIQWFAIGY